MTGMKSEFKKQLPSLFAIYEFPATVSLRATSEQQIVACLDSSRLVEFNIEAARQYGFADPEHLRGQSVMQVAQALSCRQGSEVREALQDHLQRFIANQYRLDDLRIQSHSGGVTRHIKISYHGFVEAQGLKRLLMLYQDETAAFQQEALVTRIAQSLAAESGEAFFGLLVQRLTENLQVDCALVAERSAADENLVRVVAFYDRRQGQLIDTGNRLHETSLLCADSPDGQLRYEENLLARYPQRARIQELAIDSLVAVPVWGEGNTSLGFLALLHSAPMPDHELKKSVLNIFSIRVSAEIERRRHTEQKQRRLLQQQLFIDNSKSGLFVADINPPMPLDLPLQRQVQWIAEHSKIVDANSAFLKLFGFRTLQLAIGESLIGRKTDYDFATTVRDFIANQFQFLDYLLRFHNRRNELWVSVNASGIIQDGKLVQMLGMMTDVSERVRHTQDMEYRAKHDSLTGLPNRRYFIDLVDQARKLTTPGTRHALLLLDLDGFKEVNDTLGHEIGDYLLKQIGPRFADLLPEGRAILARLGGDEFAIFVENFSERSEVAALAAALMKAIKTPFAINELELVIGGSIGISLYPENAESVSSLLRCADVAMYQAKKDSVDYCMYSLSQDHYTVRRLSLMMDIRQAIDNGELQLYYQPIVNLESQSPISFEALIRWHHPQHGLLSPGEFIPLIEITDMIMPVTWWVVENAIRQLADWKQRGWAYRISVNVSTRNLVDVGFASFIENCLRRFEVNGEYLEIEITESTLMADPEKARALLQSIAGLGCRISIDDYGTGYSSLGYLKSLPINTLKIDRSFISQMLDDSQDRIIVNSTIQLAHNLGLEVTAEGIEDLELVASLVSLGCDKGQGFYFCKPIPMPDIENWLAMRANVAAGGKN